MNRYPVPARRGKLRVPPGNEFLPRSLLQPTARHKHATNAAASLLALGRVKFALSVSSASERLKGAAEVVMGFGKPRLELNSPLQRGGRVLRAILVKVDFAEGFVSASEVRLDLNGAFEGAGAVIHAILLHVGCAQVESRVEICGVKLQGALEGGD